MEVRYTSARLPLLLDTSCCTSAAACCCCCASFAAFAFGSRSSAAGTFKLTLEFSEDYPNKAPVVKFKSTMFHPNSELQQALGTLCCCWACSSTPVYCNMCTAGPANTPFHVQVLIVFNSPPSAVVHAHTDSLQASHRGWFVTAVGLQQWACMHIWVMAVAAQSSPVICNSSQACSGPEADVSGVATTTTITLQAEYR
jgi:hypothetical protein